MRIISLLCLILAAALAACHSGGSEAGGEQPPAPQHPAVPGIRTPEGFHIAVFAENIENARSLARGEKGTIFVGSRKAGNVYAVVDRDGDFLADTTYVLASGLNMPNGVAFRNGALFVAEVDKIWRYDDIENRLADPPQPALVSDAFPSDAHHGWKYIAFGPDDSLYVPVGAPCNICNPDDSIYCTITRMAADGSGLELYAEGVRNTVGFTWQEETGDLWFTDNGRDMLGDNKPGDELNRAPRPGMHFGYPFCHQGDLSDPEFGGLRPCSDFKAPAQVLGPHVASLGVKFCETKMFPESYGGDVLIAEHGSWNRSEPIGYRLTRVRLDGDRATNYEVFAEGWLKSNGERTGRPVDLLFLPDGSLLVSDDYGNKIYRITYRGEQ